MARVFSQRVFDRPLANGSCSEQIGADLAALAGEALPNLRALGANVECDWRVSAERQEVFCSSFNDLSNDGRPEGIKQKLEYFFDKRVREVANPDFLLPWNAANRREMNRDTTVLANVFRLPIIPQVIEDAAKAVRLGALFPRRDAVDVVEQIFPPRPFRHDSAERPMILDDDQQKFLTAFLARGAKANRHPVWAGLWNEFAPFVKSGPDYWLGAFGMRSKQAQLCFLFRYRLEALDGGPVLMPTYLESRCHGEHFPSPAPRCPWRNGEWDRPLGGHPLSLRVETDEGPILQEFVHEDFARHPDMVFAWGWSEGKDSAKPVEMARADHYSRLDTLLKLEGVAGRANLSERYPDRMEESNEVAVRDWLQSVPESEAVPEETAVRLSRLLHGFSLDLAPDDEPFVPLYDWAVAERSVGKLARGVNAVLKRWLDGKWQPSLPERAQYNLLQLCVEIGDRKRLSVPLWELYRRKIVVGEYQAFRPISLTRVLLQAMIRNPLEGPVSPALWRSFLEEVPDEYLNGGPLDGFSGMLYLPHEGSPEDRVRELAVWLRKLFFRLAEESLFYAALAAMKRAEPGLAYQILKRAGLDIIEEYVAIVKERGPKAIETTLRQTNQTGNREVEEDLGSKFKEVCSALEEILRRDAGVPRLRTKTQLEGLFSSLVNKEFYSPDRDDPRRILALHVREMASVRDPESLKPQLSSFTSVA